MLVIFPSRKTGFQRCPASQEPITPSVKQISSFQVEIVTHMTRQKELAVKTLQQLAEQNCERDSSVNTVILPVIK
jgi:hypothetical protein